MLELINAERTRAGLNPVAIGSNVAAQLHAEAGLEHCFSGHWDIDGLKPYMRYSLAGGYQSNGENVTGSNYCITRSNRYRPIVNIRQEIREAMEGWMDSPGHRRNILDKWHRQVNIGLAWDVYNFKAVQHFQGDYVEYQRLPAIEKGVLTMSGTVKNGALLEGARDLGVQIFYDPPPHALTRGQLSRTYCYDPGLEIASLRYPLTANRYWTEDESTTTYSTCPNPYEVPATAPAPRSPREAHTLWQEAYDASQARAEQAITVPWITAQEWTASGNFFSMRADLSNVLATYGNGVYTIVVWGKIGGEREVISQYSLFHGITPPDTYAAATP